MDFCFLGFDTQIDHTLGPARSQSLAAKCIYFAPFGY